MLRKLVTSALPLNRIRAPILSSIHPLSTQQEPQASSNLPLYRTKESDPGHHSVVDLAKFYIIPPTVYNKLFLYKGFQKHYQQLIHLFGECCLMIREPGLEICDYLKRADYSKAPYTYMIYGRLGMGKTATMAHILHYCYSRQWMILHIPDVFSVAITPQEVIQSPIHSHLMDLPKESAQWLQNFLNINSELLETLQLKTSQRYEWSPREITEEGVPITELIDMGIKRAIYSSECVRALLREIAHHSASKSFKTIVAIDGVNHFYSTTCEDRLTTQIKCCKLTFVDAFLELIRSNKLKNGAFLFSLDNYHYKPECRNPEYSPTALLGVEGVEDLAPFVPVLVDKLTDTEFNHYLDYLTEKKWIQHPQAQTAAGRAELKFLSGLCGAELDRIVAPL